MVASGDNQSRVRKRLRDGFERFDHEFQPLVGSPFAESKNAVLGIAAPRKVGIFRPGSENAVRTQMHIIAPIFFVQYFAVAGHQDRN